MLLLINISIGELITSRIKNGEESEAAEFPHHVAIRRNSQYLCGGSILDELHIITAAHCVQKHGQKFNNLNVIAGTNDLGLWWPRTYGVKKIYIHQDYSDDKYEDDIAILRLDENIRFNNNQRPIKLPDGDTPEESDITMCGWGKLDTAGYRPVLLRKLSTRVIKNSKCQIQMGRRIYDRQICTYAPHGAGACFGDSGGGLVDGDVLVGIVSYIAGAGCGKLFPDVHTRVYHYVPWIKKTLDDDNNYYSKSFFSLFK
ncbi:hypothetical protein HCN44_011151 [Aphidius gifuensis]|uniref:Peptidase S1 domain-containing protein n=1 Tax=Aphidius gifuensis TaxID=684658 RepID=A0A834XWJ2_APHGI|nr:hypothetical protein HCN44_011151 [Aphidius gifuensis]